MLGGGELRQQICLARPHPKMMVRIHDLQFRLKCFLANQGQPCVVRRGVPHHLPPRPVRHVLLPSGLRSPGNATGSTVSSSAGRTPLQTRGQARFRRPCRTPSAFPHRPRVSSDIRRPGGQPARRSFPVAASTSRPHGQAGSRHARHISHRIRPTGPAGSNCGGDDGGSEQGLQQRGPHAGNLQPECAEGTGTNPITAPGRTDLDAGTVRTRRRFREPGLRPPRRGAFDFRDEAALDAAVAMVESMSPVNARYWGDGGWNSVTSVWVQWVVRSPDV